MGSYLAPVFILETTSTSFSFGNTTTDPLLVNLQQSGVSIDYFTANSPVANAAPADQVTIFNGTWYPPFGAPAPEGNFTSFDGSLTDDIGFARVFREAGGLPLVIEPGEIDSHTAADWTTNSTPTWGWINPTQDPNLPDPNVAVGYMCEPFKVEMVIRGYLSGHAAREYKLGKRILCGVTMAEGMLENDKFPEALITPS